MAVRGSSSRPTRPESRPPRSQIVCRYWAMSKCLIQHCPYLHPEQKTKPSDSAPVVVKGKPKAESSRGKAKAERVCKFWADGKCVKGERCPFLHTWFRGDGFSLLTKLQGHKKAITGIALPDKSSNLYSASKDGTVRVWDCNSGQCSRVINVGGEAGCLISKGDWVFCGVSNIVKAWNTDCNSEFTLDGPVGQVHALEAENGMVFAGTEEGVIYVWKGQVCSDSEANPFQPHKALSGHTGAVVSLRIGNIRLYSGSVDHTIRVWNMDTLDCAMILNGHSDTVTSFITWEAFLLSCSLDHTIKVWSMNEEGKIEETYTCTEEDGLLALSGIHDSEDQPVLLCSLKDNSVRMYDLPSFKDRGKLFAKREVQAIQVQMLPGLLFFTGDETGGLSVWKWFEPAEPALKQES